MKLITVQITEFQSVRNSNEFKVGEITCLVGKNEAGKTAILQGLYRLNPIIPADSKYDITDDYPRSEVEDYQLAIQKKTRKHALVVVTKFLLEKDEIKKIENEYGSGVLKNPELRLSKGYENLLLVGLDINEAVLVKSLIDKAELPLDLATQLKKIKTVQELVDRADEKNEGEKEKFDHLKRLQGLLADIKSSKGIVLHIYNSFLEELVPKFMYFDEYYMMKGGENIETLIARRDQKKLEKADHPLLGLIALARVDLAAIQTLQRTRELKNKLEGASNYLSKKVLTYWSQNKHLQMRIDLRPAQSGDPDGMRTGTNIWIDVYDSKHLVTTSMGNRSRGFLWFFSFLAWFDEQQKSEKPLILLLDEPGLFLHGKAQEDLLRYMEKELEGKHQVIYTTHSPFMVDSKKFDRVRIVQDESMDSVDPLPPEQEGTKVLSDVLSATKDSLFPLQGALGYEIYQTLFVGPYSLVVEGVSDLLYLQTMSGFLEKIGRIGLDIRWTITPVGGADRVPTFVALIGSQKGMTVATLIDLQKGGKQKIEDLFKRKLLKKENVMTFADFTGAPEADIEDLFEPDFYLTVVNAEYSKELSKAITPNSLKSQAPRILVRIEEYLKSHPLKQSNFNHYRPARYFSENISALSNSISKTTLDRFEAAFKALNSLL